MLEAMAQCKTTISRILLRRDTESGWATKNPILGPGELGYEIGTGRLKVGDGVTAWNSLPYYVGNGSGANGILDGGIPSSTYTDQAEIDAGGVI